MTIRPFLSCLFGFFLSCILFFGNIHVFALGYIDQDSRLINQDQNKVVNTESIDNPLRDGSYGAIRDPEDEQNGVGGLIEEGKIDSFETSQLQTLQYIKNIVNYLLGFLGFIALVYLMYHGGIIVTSGNNEEAYKQGRAGLKQAGIAIGGIALSWFLVSFIFYVIALIIT